MTCFPSHLCFTWSLFLAPNYFFSISLCFSWGTAMPTARPEENRLNSEGLFSQDGGVPRSVRTLVGWKGRLATSVPAPSSVRTSGRQLEWASGKQEWCNISLCTGSSALAEVYVHSRSRHNHLKKKKINTTPLTAEPDTVPMSKAPHRRAVKTWKLRTGGVPVVSL